MLRKFLIAVSLLVLSFGASFASVALAHLSSEDCEYGHCDTTQTDPTHTTPTIPTDTTHTTPSSPRCPPGMTPTAGKDGHPGNDECEFPPTTTTTTTPAPPVERIVTVTVTVPGPERTVTVTKIVKSKPKVVKKIVYRKKVVIKRIKIKVLGKCPPYTKLYLGHCVVPGKG